MRAMRSSLFYLAPLLARTGRADIYTPGGCRLGARPIDMHLSGLEKMGAHITEKDGGALEVTAPDGLAGADICLRFPSVGATETLLMAAAAARGETVLRGAAVEPEVTDLARFLQGAGADITGVGTRVLHIRGRELLMGTQHAVCPDRITAATVLCAVAARCCSPIPATPIWPRCCASCAGPDAWCRPRGTALWRWQARALCAPREGGIRACIHRSQRTRHP